MIELSITNTNAVTMSFNFKNHYTLNKAYFLECYDQTINLEQGLVAYKKAFILFAIGCFIAFISDEYQVVSLFIMALSAIEALSVRFHRTWWLWRQLLSKAANSRIEFTINDNNITIQSIHQTLIIPWQEVSRITKTDKGVVIQLSNNRYYLSRQYLSVEADEFITTLISD